VTQPDKAGMDRMLTRSSFRVAERASAEGVFISAGPFLTG
jgi:hypothetical protein